MGGAVEIRKRFEQQVLPHLDLLYTAAFQLTGDKRRASDLCEKALLRAYSFFPGSATVSNRRVWLLTILFEVFRVRLSAREQAPATQQPLPGSADRPVRGCDSTGAKSPDNEQPWGAEVQDRFRNLPQDYRLTLFLVDLEELGYADAAKVLEVPIETIRSRVSQGRALMRCSLRRQQCEVREGSR